MNRDHQEPMAPIAGKLIKLKETGEKLGVLPTTKFSGFGVAEEEELNDPVARLRNLVQSEHKTEKKDKKKVQKGGFLPLVPIPMAIGSAVAGKLAGDLYDFVKKKVTGQGYKVPYHKTKKLKVEFLKDIVNNID